MSIFFELESEMKELEEEAMKGNKERAERLLRELIGNNPHSNDFLHLAAKKGHVEVAKLLLASAKSQVNEGNRFGCTPLYLAAQEGRVEVVRLLLATPNIQVNAANKFDWTPLHRAVQMGHVEVIRLLLAADDIQVNAVSNDGWTPLLLAVRYGHVEVVELLLAERAIDVSAVNRNGWAPLHVAAHEGKVEIVKRFLLASPAIQVTQRNRHGQTPLYLAVRGKHEEVVKVLLSECCLKSSRLCVDLPLLHSMAQEARRIALVAEKARRIAMFKRVASFVVVHSNQKGANVEALLAFHQSRRRHLALHSLRLLCFDRLYQNRAALNQVPSVTLQLIGEQLWALNAEVELSDEDFRRF